MKANSRRGYISKLRAQLDEQLGAKEDALPRFRMVLGDGRNNLYPDIDDPTIVYARQLGRNRVDYVRNTKTISRYGLHVIVGYTRTRPDELQVIEEDISSMEYMGAYGYILNHGPQHSLFDPDGGDDTVWVWGQQFLPFLVQETDPISLHVEVRLGRYVYNGVYKTFGGGLTPDLDAFAPGAGLAIMVHVVIDAASATLDFIESDEFSVLLPEHMREDMIPLAPAGTLACGAIYVPNGITQVTWDYIHDTRPFVQAVQIGGAPHNVLSTSHLDTSPDTLVRGDLLVVEEAGITTNLTRMAVGAAHQIIKVDATGDDPEWVGFDWDEINLAAGADMVHNHLSNPEGGLLGYTLRTGWNLDVDTEVTMSWVDATRTLTLTPTGASYSFWVLGTEFTEAAPDSVVIGDIEGLWYVYYNAAGTLVASQVVWDIRNNDKAFVAVIYWDALNNEAIGGSVRWEMHSWAMTAGTHEAMHHTLGTGWATGLAVSENPADQLEVTAGIIHDEDIEVVVTDSGVTGTWQQELSPLQSYKTYKLGAPGDWRHGGVFGVVPIILDGGNDVQWNEFAGGVWGLTAAGANQYCAYWVLCTPDVRHPIVVVVGQGSPSSNIDTARDNNPLSTLDLTTEGPEYHVLARVMVRNIAGGVFYEVSEIDDFRLAGIVPFSGTLVDHNALPGVQGGAAGEFYHLDAIDYAALTDPNAQLPALHTDGSPTFADVFVPDGGVFGNAPGTARLGFDSSGAVDYAYFLGCNVGVGTATPGANIASIAAYPGQVMHLQGAASGDRRATYIAQSATVAEYVWSDTGAGADDKLWVVRASGDSWRVLPFTDDGAAALNSLVVRSYNAGGYVGIHTLTPNYPLEVGANADASVAMAAFFNPGAATAGRQTYFLLGKSLAAGGGGAIGLISDTATPANARLVLGHWGDSEATEYLNILKDGNVGAGIAVPRGKIHVDNVGAIAQPVAVFDQGDVSEEMFEYACTIGVGNAIEAVGGKTLTTTHFIKVTLPGGLTRYHQVGTIA